VDPAIEMGVNVRFSPANLMQEARALITGNSSATGPAPYQGTLVGNGPQEGTELVKGIIL